MAYKMIVRLTIPIFLTCLGAFLNGCLDVMCNLELIGQKIIVHDYTNVTLKPCHLLVAEGAPGAKLIEYTGRYNLGKGGSDQYPLDDTWRDGQFLPTPEAHAEFFDRCYFQIYGTATFDLGGLFRAVYVALSHDHGPYPEEALEYRLWISQDGINFSMVPSTTHIVLYRRGWSALGENLVTGEVLPEAEPSGQGRGTGSWADVLNDDYTALWYLPEPARFVRITPLSSYSPYNEPEIDAIIGKDPVQTGQDFTHEEWSFAIITDLHVGYGIPDYGTVGWNNDSLIGDPNLDDYYLTRRIEQIVEWINSRIEQYNIKFVVILGDITDTAQKSQFEKAKSILDQFFIPYFPIVGNHDIAPYALKPGTNPDRRILDARYGEGSPGSSYFLYHFDGSFIQLQCSKLGAQCFADFSSTLVNYYVDYNGIRFIFLDTSTRKPSPFGPGVGSDAQLFPATLDFLRKVLPSDRDVILLSHHPLRSNFTSFIYGFSDAEIRDIEQLIENSGARVLASFAGHTHNNLISYSQGKRGDVIETEAILESSDVAEVIRLVRVYYDTAAKKFTINTFFPTPSHALDANINPFFTFEPQNIKAGQDIAFSGCYKPDKLFDVMGVCPSSGHDNFDYYWSFSDENITYQWTKDISHRFSAPGTYIVTLAVAPKTNPLWMAKVWQRIEVTR